MAKPSHKPIPGRKRRLSRASHRRFPVARRSSRLKPSAETLASLHEDSRQLPTYNTADELIRSLEAKSAE